MDYEKSISQFVGSTREFCEWVEGTAGSNEVFDAMRLVSRLHADVIMLPSVGDDYLPTEDDIPEMLVADKQAARARFSTFTFQYYWVVFTPMPCSSDRW
jgi:hypothetical protein